VKEVEKKLLMGSWNMNTLCEAKFVDVMNMALPSYSFNSSLSA
jgi:hypothetical protein